MLALAAVVPHGDEILIPENEEMQKLHDAMVEVGKSIGDVDSYIFVTPHNIRIDTHIGIIGTEHLSGVWTYREVKIGKNIPGHRELSSEIYRVAVDRNIPAVFVNFGALEGEYSRMPLDWGTLIPMHFLPERKTSLVTPARSVEREKLVELGRVMAEISERRDEKIALVVSADHAHTHSPSGPYGFSPKAKEYDRKVIKALREMNLGDLIRMDESLIAEALPDSYWQLLILAGALENMNMHPEIIEYGVAEYFGMAVALIKRR